MNGNSKYIGEHTCKSGYIQSVEEKYPAQMSVPAITANARNKEEPFSRERFCSISFERGDGKSSFEFNDPDVLNILLLFRRTGIILSEERAILIETLEVISVRFLSKKIPGMFLTRKRMEFRRLGNCSML